MRRGELSNDSGLVQIVFVVVVVVTGVVNDDLHSFLRCFMSLLILLFSCSAPSFSYFVDEVLFLILLMRVFLLFSPV